MNSELENVTLIHKRSHEVRKVEGVIIAYDEKENREVKLYKVISSYLTSEEIYQDYYIADSEQVI